ncbi:MAG TPA: cell division topological specificity factor MinE [Candidatus Sulfotelmatobacter sp.]|nr:cell division topological specificity factor MinE [Candidatus Sulfotelmatobacter sp.]
MFEFIKKLFGPEPSSVTARERLRLVLLSDHLSLAPDVVESLKGDLIEVISRYCEVDVANCDVTFEQQDKQVAMLANIPILGMRSRQAPRTPEPPPAPAPPPVSSTPAAAQSTAHPAPSPPKAGGAGAGAPRRRRRRKSGGVAPNAAPQAT